MLQFIITVISPLLSLVLFTLANSFLNTLLIIRLQGLGSGPFLIGVMSSFYYLGFIIGAFFIQRFIQRVGHIRAYTAFASVISVVSILHGLVAHDLIWLLLRFIYGYCTAGIFLVIESWLLTLSTYKIRGQVLAVYMISFYLAQALGQLFLNVGNIYSIVPFCIMTFLSSLSVLPVAATRIDSPKVKKTVFLTFRQLYRISPSGVYGCFCGGIIISVIYGLLPMVLKGMKYDISGVSVVMMITILGGMALQYPIGKFSDYFDRRRVLLIVTIVTAVLCLVFMPLRSQHKGLFMGISFLFGGLAFTLYPLSISYTCDSVESREVTAVVRGLLLAFSLGSTAGPAVASSFISVMGVLGFYVFCFCACAALALFISWRSTKVASRNVDEQQNYLSVSQNTPITCELDPRVNEPFNHNTSDRNQ